MWISKTPLRASFLGGGTDYPSHFRSNPGAVLGGTIDKYVYIQALPLSAVAEQAFRVTYRTTESVRRIEDIQHPVVREALKLYGWSAPLNIATMSDLPGSTGLGSSSAFTVGFINLINRMRGIELTRYELARQAIHMEQDILQENVGVQDQIHAAFGGLARYEFTGDSFSIEPLRLTTSRLTLLNSSLLLVYTGGQRSASAVLQNQEQRTKSGANEGYLREMYDMTRVGASLLEAQGDDLNTVVRFAELLDHGWKLKRQLGSSVSNSAIDDLYVQGKELGAWGGKLLGAGGGGFVLFLVDPNLRPLFSDRFGDGNVIPVSLTNGGSTVSNIL
ncbi:D-glycero-alpha-D-manno-heptose-7-phosphate kinase [Angulomicrobium tetraedrale]|uniref:D-glycero-alpha-D-manno-heptose-7-phosphate kinase n=1 Tax=Ancylobacter tetraedralis TaxID=217068 RepID=A0A839ZFU7_9HYPH|nr:galactokinase [Ancylobacter tetraedralis]MBB3773713.1 D-glycero-alpha-D-manno-heptose-7-phosphate kinase [Ancylobacter tetraedralis]